MGKKTDVKKIEILGMHLDNYTVRESLLRLDTYMGNTVLNIIETVTMKQLVLAGEHPVIKDCLNQADLCIIGECEILSEAGNPTKEELEQMQRIFEEKSPKFAPAGVYAVEMCTGDLDTIVNEMNGSTPDLVISALDSPMEEEFILSYRDKIGTSVWYGIGASYQYKAGKMQVGKTFQRLALRGRLHLSVSKYRQKENKD